jgi:hypothetical protein
VRYAKAPAHVRGAIRAAAARWQATDGTPLLDILDGTDKPCQVCGFPDWWTDNDCEACGCVPMCDTCGVLSEDNAAWCGSCGMCADHCRGWEGC